MSAERNRAAFPLAARMVDDFRAVFGDDTKVVYAVNSAGDTLGATPEAGVPWLDWPTRVDSTVPRSKRK